MSGTSDHVGCPNCGYAECNRSEDKIASELTCINCGLETSTNLRYMSLEELNEWRVTQGLHELQELPEQTFNF